MPRNDIASKNIEQQIGFTAPAYIGNNLEKGVDFLADKLVKMIFAQVLVIDAYKLLAYVY